MIAASEPLEFVPHGRSVIVKHPGQIYTPNREGNSENSLLYKLTNFAIKDDSFVEREDKEKEWWTIREVYYKKTEDFKEDEPQSPKSQKDDLSDSFRLGSRLKTDFNMSVKSEIIASLRKMEAEAAQSGPSRGGSANSSSNMSKKFNLYPSNKNKTAKRMNNPKIDCHYEEELYVKGCTAVWSKGLNSSPATGMFTPECRETIACYTCENPIKHAVFCDFHVNFNNTMLIDALNSQIGDEKKSIKIEDTTEHIPTKVMPSLLLLDNKCMRVFATDGREYVTSLPFQVKKVWNIKYGILLEKDATPLLHNSLLTNSFMRMNESHNFSFSKSRSNFTNMSAKLRAESISGYDQDYPLPTCFSLTHPLDDVTPILVKSHQGLQYYNDSDLQIIFASANPSIVFTYDWKLGIHSLWKLRKTTRDECLTMCPNPNTSETLSQTCEFGSRSFNLGNKHTNSWMTAIASPYTSRKNTNTPTRSHVNSPMANAFHQQGMSPHGSIIHTSMSMLGGQNQSPPTLPLYPDICIEHMWTESQPVRRDPIENQQEIKSFIHEDLVGHEYLCYILKVNGISQLQMMRLQKSNCHGKVTFIVGTISTFIAKDAVVLNDLKMVALIDELGNIIMQSGNHIVGKVHVGGVLARLIDSPYTKRSMFASPFPRRSSLLPTRSHDTSVFDDSALHLLSPVPHTSRSQKDSLGLQSLCDAVGNRLTLRFDKGVMYRITLPDVATSHLVLRCCTALKAILPKDIAIQIIIKWYGVRNAPGTQDLTLDQEWSMFANLLYSLIGYDVEKLGSTKKCDDENTEVVPKKQRTSSDGSVDDWDYLLNSKLHKNIGSSLANLLHLNEYTTGKSTNMKGHTKKNFVDFEHKTQFNQNSILFPYIIHILFSFHLVYEETKLNSLLCDDLKHIAGLLHQLSKDLRLDNYVTHYWLDFPVNLNFEYDRVESQLTEEVLKSLTQPNYFSCDPPSIFKYINGMLKEFDVGSYPYLAEVNEMSKNIIEVLSIANGGGGYIQSVCHREGVQAASTPRAFAQNVNTNTTKVRHIEAVEVLCQRGITVHDVDNLPPAIALLLMNIFVKCKMDPPVEWPLEAYNLIMREDLALQAELVQVHDNPTAYMEALALEVLEKETAFTQNISPIPKMRKNDEDIRNGLEYVDTKALRLLYPKDHRTVELCNLLQSSLPVTINLIQRPEVSDHDFIEEQEKQLYAICTRTTALPIGRGMVSLRSTPCVPTELLNIPRLNVSGRGPPPRCNTIELAGNSGENHPHCLIWPNFHNGVATGLALVPMTGSNINASWVTFNKPKNSTEVSSEHAGFLMALGLNGHLKDMPFMNMYEYLVKCQEMTSVGLLLGLAATYRGTMDLQATKMLSIHLEPLLPPTSIELDIPQNILVAALLGIGLLYQDTHHAHMAHVLLHEIAKPPGPEMESSVERETYSLAAGLALGMVLLGHYHRHKDPHNDRDQGHHLHHGLVLTLRSYVLGGDKMPLQGAQKEKYKQGSFAVREGTTINLDVTSPGATLALALIFVQSNHSGVASWLQPPNSAYLLDDVRPDLLMLRTVARGLIMWDHIEPEIEWVESQIPDTIKPFCLVKPTDENIDYEAMNQAYCNIVAGACFAMGIRFAGSNDEDARATLLHYLRVYTQLSNQNGAELAGKTTVETCLNVILISVSMVCAGRGDISVMRVIRRLRSRVFSTNTRGHHALTHGGQMAVHMALGLLFLGGGRCTLGTSKAAIAALLTAFFPKYPTHCQDNRYHLQAFRHLYVLAVEPRLVVPRDIHTGQLCYAHLQVVTLTGDVKTMRAPCLLPELKTLKEVRIHDERYWPIVFQKDRNWRQLEKFLELTWCIDVKQRAGCLSYLEDPEGFQTILAQTLTFDKTTCWAPTPQNIHLFTSDEDIRDFTKNYLTKYLIEKNICSDCSTIQLKRRRRSLPRERSCTCLRYGPEELACMQELCTITYDCVVRDIMCILPVWVTFMKIINTMRSDPTSFHVWQMKLLQAQVDKQNMRAQSANAENEYPDEPLISNEFTQSIMQRLNDVFDSYDVAASSLKKYLGLPSAKKLGAAESLHKKILSALVVYYDLPKDVFADGFDVLETILKSEQLNLNMNAFSRIMKLVS